MTLGAVKQEEISAWTDPLESVGLDGPPRERKAPRAMERIDLEFGEKPHGAESAKRWLATGRKKTNALLAEASRAFVY